MMDGTPAEPGMLHMWVWYRHPADMPGVVDMVRRWDVTGTDVAPTDVYIIATPEVIRDEMAHKGLHFVNRASTDDPVIIGTFIGTDDA